ncbi:MAG TPA: superoxide dismutase family protein [Umezawaea sp.]|nr:superoxide dismutase family protein [Umezawaea sp.]
MRCTVGVLLGVLALTSGLAACSSGAEPTAAAGTPERPVFVELATPRDSGTQPVAISYNAELVPVGAKVAMASEKDGSGTKVTMTVEGLLPNHEYGAHVHTKPCGAKPADAGPHYQNDKDPVSPSVDPAFANKDNEIWLDFTTDAKGDAAASASVKWSFRGGEANAAVIHAAHTMTEAGKAGTAGDRLACLTTTF